MNTNNVKIEAEKSLSGQNPYNFLEYYFPISADPTHEESNRVRMFKNGYRQALKYFYYKLIYNLKYKITTPHSVIAVPSSTAGKINSITKIAKALPLNNKLLTDATDALQKIYTTKSFCKTNQRDTQNLLNSFKVNRSLIEGKDILLVDDVTSTGKTFTAISDLLLANGANSVLCISIAKTVKLKNLI
jgi:predicted amidophosphoribosyltransferase